MSETFSLASIERLLGDTRDALQRMQPNAAASGGAAAEPLRAEASDTAERATAVVASPGRIVSLRLDPRLLRDGSEAVCDAVTEAVNAALTRLQDQAIDAAGGLDTATLAVDLERLQADSLTSAATLMASLDQAMTRISAPVERTRR